MKSKAIFMALLAFAFGAQAVPVSRQDVTVAAQAWARSGTTMGQAINDTIAETREFAVANGQSFYALKMKDGKTIVMSSDTEFDPVIAFSSDPNLNLEEDSPLVKILRQDIIIRTQNKADNAVTARLTGALPGSAPTAAAAASKWSALLGTSQSGASSGAVAVRQTAGTGGCAEPVSSVDDVRVAPLVQSKWSQSSTTGPCYNYYTPNSYPCGCTATAAAQIMRYFCFPTAEMPSYSYTCKVDGQVKSLQTIGGVYPWDLMTYVYPKTEESREAVGRLTYDIGVALGSSYTASATGASGEETAQVFKGKSFGYKNAFVYGGTWYSENPHEDYFPTSSEESLHNEEVRKLVIYANLDAKRPVQLGIFGDQPGMGHSVVGDGYGFKKIDGVKTAFVHINMGWAGTDDVWYNLPEIDAKQSGATMGGGAMDFTKLMTCTFNISPDNTGEILSGRTVKENGKPMSDVVVTAYDDGRQVASTVSDGYGVYAFSLPASKTYDLKFMSSDGEYAADDISVSVGKTTSGASSHGGNFDIVWGLGKIGNNWGNDVVMQEIVFDGSVQNTRTGTLYGTLDDALNEVEADDTLEILSKTLLRVAQTVGKTVTIRTATGVSPSEAPVICRAVAAHGFTNVTSGATLALENVVFMKTKGCFVDVAKGGKLQVSGVLGLDDAEKVGGTYVHTATGDGFYLAGAIGSYLQIRCDEATRSPQVFGKAWSVSGAQGCAKYLLNADDEELAGAVNTDTLELYWDIVEPSPERASVYYTADRGETRTFYMKLSSAINNNLGDGDVYILKETCPLTLPADIVGRKRLLCTNETPAVVTYANRDVLITVKAQQSLVVSNVTVTGASRQGAFVVEGGELTLDADTLIANCTNSVGFSEDFTKPSAGAVTVQAFNDNATYAPGKLTMLAGSVISNCTTTGCGGGVYVGGELYDSGVCSFDLFGGKIVDCTADGPGGGAYVGYGSAVNVKGDATVTGNKSSADFSGSNMANDNLDLSEGGTLMLAGMLSGRVNVRGCEFDWMGYGNCDGGLFGSVAAACGEIEATVSAYSFRCDVKTEDHLELRGEYVLDEAGNRMLAWSDQPVPTQYDEPTYPVAWVIYDLDDGSTLTNRYGSLDAALASVVTNATVEINEWLMVPDEPGDYSGSTEQYDMMTGLVARLTKSVVIRHDVLLRTTDNADGDVNTIWQSGPGRMTVANGGKLTLENIVIRGLNPEIVPTGVTTNDDVEVTYFKYSLAQGGNSGVFGVEKGGELVLANGSKVCDFKGQGSRAAAAICAEGGTVRLQEGSEVSSCINTFRKDEGQPENNSAPAGGILMNDGLLSLEGGAVHGCGAIVGGGVLAENCSRVEVSGKSEITGNYLLVGSKMPTDPSARTNANLSVANEAVNGLGKRSELVLVGEFTGSIGILEPRQYGQFVEEAELDTNVFGKVSSELNPREFQTSAANFTHDAASGVTGKIALSGNPDNSALLVWTTALVDGTYTDPETGEKYDDVEDFQMVDYPVPVLGLVYDGTLKTGVVEHVGYTLTGNTAIPAGEYMATATLDRKWMWSDGTVGPVKVNWEIAENPTPPPPPQPTEIDPPTAVTGLVYNGNEQTGVVASVGFTLTGNIGTNAGPYTAVAKLEEGYVWTGGGTEDQPIDWSIAKAEYDMSDVVFTNVTYVCDGTTKSNLVDETTLPAGVSVTNYLNNGQTEVGVYTVTAQFGGDEVNYKAIPDMTATLTITEAPTPPPPQPPQWDVITNHPTHIAFQSIDRVGDTEWKLVITNRVEYCNYRLLWTEDLTKGFTETGKWEHAVGPAAEPVWTTNVITTGGAWFWRAEGTEGTNMVPHVEK